MPGPDDGTPYGNGFVSGSDPRPLAVIAAASMDGDDVELRGDIDDIPDDDVDEVLAEAQDRYDIKYVPEGGQVAFFRPPTTDNINWRNPGDVRDDPFWFTEYA